MGLALTLAFGGAGVACDDEPAPRPGVVFLAGSGAWAGPHDGGGVRDSGGTLPPDTVAGDAGAGEDADTGCSLASPFFEIQVVHGLTSTYSRGATRPSLRQWSDSARRLGLRALALSEHHVLDSPDPADRLSDAQPDGPAQALFEFDAKFNRFERNGDGAATEVVSTDDEPDLLESPGIRLTSVAEGFASARHDPDPAVDLDRQEATLMLRLKAPRKVAPYRILVNVNFGVGNNIRTLTWLEATDYAPELGEPLPGTVGSDFRTFHLPVKERVLSSPDLGEPLWREGSLRSVEVRVEGEVVAVVDHVRYNATAWYADYVEEAESYRTSQVRIIPGIGYALGDPPARFTCLGAPAFPAGVATLDGEGIAALKAAGCFVLAEGPVTLATPLPAAFAAADAFAVWAPDGDGVPVIDAAFWDDALAARGGPFPALAATSPTATRDLTARSSHNRVLVTEISEAGVRDAVSAGRVILSDDTRIVVDLWAEGPDCRRTDVGGDAAGASLLHVLVGCPAPETLQSAELVRVAAGGARTAFPFPAAASGASFDVSAWQGGYVRLEATCSGGGRVFTNPIWF